MPHGSWGPAVLLKACRLLIWRVRMVIGRVLLEVKNRPQTGETPSFRGLADCSTDNEKDFLTFLGEGRTDAVT